jgi:nuclear transport factor 2 (NTF2) superfamily protein
MSADPDLTREAVLAWVAAHDRAWRSNDPDAIGALFTEDGIYHLGPWEGPWRGHTGPIFGRTAIVDLWTSTFDPDERFTADANVLAIDGRRGVVQRTISYESIVGHPGTRYSCVWIVDLDSDGRCRNYQEWFVEQPSLGR